MALQAMIKASDRKPETPWNQYFSRYTFHYAPSSMPNATDGLFASQTLVRGAMAFTAEPVVAVMFVKAYSIV